MQGGWMRGDARVLDPAKSTELEPVQSLRQADAAPLPPDQFVKATIPLYYQGHVYRAGSRIRVRISAPGGDAPFWSFAESPNIQADVAIGRGPGMPSRLLLPVTADGAAPDRPASLPRAPRPAVPGLCRPSRTLKLADAPGQGPRARRRRPSPKRPTRTRAKAKRKSSKKEEEEGRKGHQEEAKQKRCGEEEEEAQEEEVTPAVSG